MGQSILDAQVCGDTTVLNAIDPGDSLEVDEVPDHTDITEPEVKLLRPMYQATAKTSTQPYVDKETNFTLVEVGETTIIASNVAVAFESKSSSCDPRSFSRIGQSEKGVFQIKSNATSKNHLPAPGQHPKRNQQ
jgi:hypothetical protein